MAIDDPRNVTSRFTQDTEGSQSAPRLRASDSVALNRLGGGMSTSAPSSQPDVEGHGVEYSFEAHEAEDMADDRSNPLLQSLGSMLTSADPEPAQQADLRLPSQANTTAPALRSLFATATRPADAANMLQQPQVASALAFGSLVAGCAVGALTLGLGGAIIAFAAEALAFAGGMLVSRANTKQLQQANEKLLYEATHDGMTGLLNRKTVMASLDEVAEKSPRARQHYAVMMVDVDHFKKINDTHGHQAGDDVLRAVAGRLQECLREGAQCGRYGGEEFLVLLPDATTSAAYTAGERVRKAIASDPVKTDYGVIAVTASIGIAGSDREGYEPQKLLRAADEALYRAKHGGRNRVEVALG